MEDGSDDSGDEDHGVTIILTTAKIMRIGLKLMGYTTRRIRRAKKKFNLDRFGGHFGCSPQVCATIWEDLQATAVEAARVEAKDLSVKHFLMALHHLKRYPTQIEREAIFDISLGWGSAKCWFYIEKIQALKEEKIVWPEGNFGDDIWVMSVDGTHCWIQEPQHPTWSQDSDYYSHKYGKAGLNYELGLSLSSSNLVWLNGPFKAGQNDVLIFTTTGLQEKLSTHQKKAIGDGGYRGHAGAMSTPNAHDSKVVAKFKSRALKRQEKFNGLTICFDCLSGRFRHSVDRFKNCFEAVCVICQYKIEIEVPLYDIQIDELLEM